MHRLAMLAATMMLTAFTFAAQDAHACMAARMPAHSTEKPKDVKRVTVPVKVAPVQLPVTVARPVQPRIWHGHAPVKAQPR